MRRAPSVQAPRTAKLPLRRLSRGVGTMPSRAYIYELGARDGLQNEPTIVPTHTKIEFIDLLSRTGVAAVEATSFVSPQWVPQMADHDGVMKGISTVSGVQYPVLVPNMKGFESAMVAGAKGIAVMTIPSETFAQKNLNSSVEQATERAVAITQAAKAAGVRCRAYISCSLGCPFEGYIQPHVIAALAKKMVEAGCYEVCLADTIGAGTPGEMNALLSAVIPQVHGADKLAVHCHDTYGQALANILCALQHGVTVIDSSVAGLGGCPFAGPGASGNVATEDVVYMLNGLGIASGVDFELARRAGEFIIDVLGRPNSSRAAVATKHRK